MSIIGTVEEVQTFLEAETTDFVYFVEYLLRFVALTVGVLAVEKVVVVLEVVVLSTVGAILPIVMDVRHSIHGIRQCPMQLTYIDVEFPIFLSDVRHRVPPHLLS